MPQKAYAVAYIESAYEEQRIEGGVTQESAY